MYVQFDSVWKRKFFLHVQKSERLKDKCKAAVFSLKSCLSWPIPVSKNPGGDSKLFSFFILFTINLSSVQGWPQTTREGLLNKCATAMVTARVLCAKAICRFIENEQLRQDFQLKKVRLVRFMTLAGLYKQQREVTKICVCREPKPDSKLFIFHSKLKTVYIHYAEFGMRCR